MIQQFVNGTSLSCLLNGHIESERFPEPFRLQKDIQYCVTYEEYIKYVSSLTDGVFVRLMTDWKLLRNMAETEQMPLYSCFLADMAFAQMKELHFAETLHKQASVIVPVADCKPTACSSLVKMHLTRATSRKAFLLAYCRNVCGLFIPDKPQACNQSQFDLAVVIYYISQELRFTGNEMSLMYDL